MKSAKTKTIVVITIIVVMFTAAVVYGKMAGKFEYKDHLDEVVIFVDDHGITLRELGYYIYDVEAFVQQQALIYDPKNPKQWWNTHFLAGADSQFVCDYAKKVATSMCILEEIYYKKAFIQGLTLSDAEQEQAENEAQEMFQNMTQRQLEVTGLNKADIVRLRRKHMLASKYARYIIENENLAGYSGKPEELVNWDGAYYQEEILPKYVIQMNDKILDNITLGKITVN